MGFGDSGLAGLRSVLAEQSIINSNITGTNITGYKSSSMGYGGAGAISSPNGALQTPDTSLLVNYTNINFQQGQITGTGQNTDLAINGEGFFLLQQAQDVGVNQPTLLTRDGSFRFSNIPALGGNVLTTPNGLVALRDNGAGTYLPILDTDFKNNSFRPSVVMPDASLDSLKFSNKGSAVFEFLGTFKNATGSQVIEGSLESSNVDAYESLAALSLSQKKFSAMAAQLKADQTNIDIMINLIR